MNNETIWKNNELKSLSFKFHYMRHLIPAETHKSSVIFRNIFPHNNVWLKIRFPLNLNVHKTTHKNYLCKDLKNQVHTALKTKIQHITITIKSF